MPPFCAEDLHFSVFHLNYDMIIMLLCFRAYGVLLWEITSYGLTPLNDYVAQEIIDMAQDNTLKHNQ